MDTEAKLQSRQSRFDWPVAALLISLLVLAPFYLWRLLWLIQTTGEQAVTLPGPLLLWHFLAGLWLGDANRYLVTTAAAILSCVAVFGGGRSGRLRWVLSGLVLSAAIAFPLCFTYQPALIAPDRQTYVPTMPGLLDGAVKRVQAGAEMTPSTYTLAGWSDEGTLYYEEATGHERRLWAFKPTEGANAKRVQTLPADLRREGRWPSVLAWLRAPGLRPDQEAELRAGHLKGQHFASADGRWVALVARHFYGPEDVIIVSSEQVEES